MVTEEIPPLVRTSVHPALWVSEGSDYVGSVLLDDALWRRLAGPQAGEEVAVCLPHRHVLIAYFVRDDPPRQIDFALLCQQFAEPGAVRFSNRVVRRINDNWELK